MQRDPDADRPQRLRLVVSQAQVESDVGSASGAVGDASVWYGADPALFNGHPAGSSRRQAAGRLGTALWEVFPGHVALLDRDGIVVSVNRAWRDFALQAGGSPMAGLGSSYLDVCARAAADGEPEALEAAALVRDALRGRDPGRRHSYRCADGRWFTMQAVPIPGLHSGALVVHTDITPEVLREQGWQHRALHDPLTGLPNRALLADRLEHAVAGAARDPESLAVLFVDLVAFKNVNDRLGHDAGDQVLREAASRMARSLRTADTIGRWGGDEFLVIAERLDRREAGEELAARIASSLDRPMAIAGEHLCVRAVVGLAHLRESQSPAELVRAADVAMLRARASSAHPAR